MSDIDDMFGHEGSDPTMDVEDDVEQDEGEEADVRNNERPSGKEKHKGQEEEEEEEEDPEEDEDDEDEDEDEEDDEEEEQVVGRTRKRQKVNIPYYECNAGADVAAVLDQTSQ